MRFVLAALTLFLTLSSVFSWDPGPAPGVKIKNFLLYLLIMGLVFSYANGRKFKIQLPSMNVAFIVLIGYSILTYLAIVLFIEYPRYDMLTSAFDLKNRGVDYMLFFLAFFYGVRSEKDATFVLKCLLLSWVVSHAVAVMDAFGYVHIGDIERRGDGRVQGAVGESNQYGAFVALTLPAAVAMAVAEKGWRRWLWIGASALTAGTLLMTVSRGAFVATFVATIAGAYLFRRYLSLGKIMTWGMMAAGAHAGHPAHRQPELRRSVVRAGGGGLQQQGHRRHVLGPHRDLVDRDRDDVPASADAADGLRLECLLDHAVPVFAA